MKPICRRLPALTALALVLALLAGCGSKPASAPAPAAAPADAPKAADQKPAEQKPAPVTVKVGNVSSLLFAPLYIAMDKGYMQEQGITVSLETLQAGQDAMVFLAQGQLDFVLAGYSAGIFNSVSRGLDLKVIAPMGTQPKQGDPSPMVVREDLYKAGLTTAAGLKGKRIASTGGMGATGSFLAAQRLAKYGLTLADVELVNIGLPDQPAALASGKVDAAMMSEPYSTKALTDHIGEALDPGMLAGTSSSGLLTSGAMLKNRADVVNRFTTALLKAARDLQGDKYKSDANIAIFAKYTKLDPAVLKNVTPYDFDPNFDLTATQKALTAMQDVWTKAGTLKLQAPVSISAIVDDSAAKAAVAKLGK